MLPADFHHDVTGLPGVGPKTAAALAGIGIRTCADLLFHFPSSYQDRRHPVPLSRAPSGEKVFVRARVTGQGRVRLRKGGFLLKIMLEGDGRGELLCFNRPFLADVLVSGTELALYGTFARNRGIVQSSDFEYEVVGKNDAGTAFGRVVPVYPLTRGVTQRILRAAIHSLLERTAGVPEFLPEYLIRSRRLMPAGEMLAALHFPVSPEAAVTARQNMAYQEFFLFQCRLIMRRYRRRSLDRNRVYETEGAVARAEAAFGFRLTSGQRAALNEMLGDFDRVPPMQRLLMGDVGSGKTAVAAALALVVALSGYQVALVAPTVVLAHQLYLRFREYLGGCGITVVFLSGKMSPGERQGIGEKIAAGEVRMVVGTHLLFGETVAFARLGLAIVDEQHRFGVAQRQALQEKGTAVDYLAMSATPIPRSLALTMYGDLDISAVHGLPEGRQPVSTRVIVRDDGAAEELMGGALSRGEQVLIVYPLIDETSDGDTAAAESGYRDLVGGPFARYGVEILHGRMEEQDKLGIMDRFRAGDFGILVATTIIEVGVDNPRATLIIIRGAERFGLAQLHQLRGRVGRGGLPGVCLLIPTRGAGEEAMARLGILVRERDGFRIAEEDLKRRGQGDLFGRLQAGAPVFHIADPVLDSGLAETARNDAVSILEKDPGLQQDLHAPLRAELEEIPGGAP